MANPLDVARAFRLVYNGQMNFMTRRLVAYGSRGSYGYEISTGTGIRDQPIFGVTVVNMDTKTADHEKSALFQSLEEAKAYISSGFDPSEKE